MPVFLCDARLGRVHRDFEPYLGYCLVSDRMKAVLKHVDSSALAFLKCKVLLPDGTSGPNRWLCDVVRELDALDEERSTMAIRTARDGSKVYNMFGGEILVFKDDVVGSNHVFRMMYYESEIVCDEEIKQACKAAELVGIRFASNLG
jgi:hypothetical protein